MSNDNKYEASSGNFVADLGSPDPEIRPLDSWRRSPEPV